MGHDPAQGADSGFKLPERRRVLPGYDQVNLLRQRLDRFIEPDQAFGGRQALQLAANVRKPALDCGKNLNSTPD